MRIINIMIRVLVGLIFCWPLITFALFLDVISNLFYFVEFEYLSSFFRNSAWSIDRFAMNAYLYVLNHELSSDELGDM